MVYVLVHTVHPKHLHTKHKYKQTQAHILTVSYMHYNGTKLNIAHKAHEFSSE